MKIAAIIQGLFKPIILRAYAMNFYQQLLYSKSAKYDLNHWHQQLLNTDRDRAIAAVSRTLKLTQDPQLIWMMALVAQKRELTEVIALLTDSLPVLEKKSMNNDPVIELRKIISSLVAIDEGHCLCYVADLDPTIHDFIQIDHQITDHNRQLIYIYVHCTRCGQPFMVEEDGNYHYTKFKWIKKEDNVPWNATDFTIEN